MKKYIFIIFILMILSIALSSCATKRKGGGCNCPELSTFEIKSL